MWYRLWLYRYFGISAKKISSKLFRCSHSKRALRPLSLESLEDRHVLSTGLGNIEYFSGLESVTSPHLAVTLNTPATKAITVNYAVTGGTASSGADFKLTAGKLTFQPGDQVEFLPLTIVSHTINEPNKTIQISLSSPGNANLGASTLIYTILNDVPVPTAAFLSTTPNSGPQDKNATLTIGLSAPSAQKVTVDYSVTGGTAVAGTDYKTISGVLTFNPGQTSKTVVLPVLNDHLFQDDKTVQLSLSNPTNATLPNNPSFTYTINDINAQPSVGFSLTTGSGVEGRTASLQVALSSASGNPVTVSYAATGGTATNGVDYSLSGSSLTFNPGQKVLTIPLTLLNTGLVGSNKTIVLTLSGPAGATLGTKSSLTYTILEQKPVVGFASAAASGPATQNGSLSVALNAASSKAITVHYAVTGGTAQNGTDYKLSVGTLTIPAGQTTANIPFTVINHNVNEADKTIAVSLSAPNGAALGTASAVYTILNTVSEPSLSFAASNPTSVLAGKTATFQVTLSAASGQTVTTQYAVIGGTAVAGVDYKAASGTLTFKPGQTTQSTPLTVLNGFLPNKSVQLGLSNLLNAEPGTTTWTTTISETRPTPIVPTVSFLASDPTSGKEGTSVALKVNLSLATTDAVTVQYSVIGGTGVAGTDFKPTSGTLTFAPGQTSQTITLSSLNNHLYESTRTVELGLANPANATLGSAPTLIYTINGINPAPSLAFGEAAASVASGQSLTVPVTLSAASKDPVTVTYSLSGNAQSGVDYTISGGSTVTFNPGQTTQDISVNLLRTFSIGGNKTLAITLGSPSGAILGKNKALSLTILDSLAVVSLSGLASPPSPPTITIATGASGTANQNVTVTGQVADSGGLGAIEWLKAEVDNTLVPITFDSSGDFSYTTTLPLNGSADGAHTIQIEASDWLGNVTTQSAGSFTLSTQGPAITITSPNNNAVINSNITVVGSVVDASSTITSLDSQLDGGVLVPVSFDGSGAFAYTTAFALDGSADGTHTIQFTATNSAGIKATTDLTFVLQTQATSQNLAFNITAPGSNDVVSDTARLIGSAGAAATSATFSLDGGTAIPLNITGAGNFNQPISAQGLSAGAHQLVVTATNGSGQTVQQTIPFTVSTTAFTIGGSGTAGWGQQNSGSVYIGNQNSLVVQSSMSAALGQSEGSRTISFDVNPSWDPTDEPTATGDVFEVYLMNTTTPSQTLLASGGTGTALFILPQNGVPQYLPGLVTFDGSQVSIDATSLASATSGNLVFQLVSDGSGTNSTVDVTNISDTVNPTGSASPEYREGADTIDPAGAALTGTLTAANNVAATISNERLNPATGTYVAELRVENNGSALASQQLAVAFPGLPAGVALEQASGTTGGSVYMNMQGAIPAGGLAAGAASAAVLVTFSDPTLARFALAPKVLAGAVPQGPVLSPLGPYTVAPGGYLSIPLQATDSDGGTITYSLQSSGTLPTGTLEANTLIFQPSPTDVGTYNFTITASEGASQTSEPVTLTVTGSQQTDTSISGVVDSSSGTPLAGIPVSLGDLSTTTNAQGAYTFTYSGAAPDDSVVVHGDEATGATSYEGFSVPLDQLTNEPIYSGFTNVVGRPTYLTPLDTAGAVTVNPKATVTVTSSSNPNIVLTIPAGSLYDQNGNLYSGKVTLTVVPVAATPIPLPAGENPPMTVLISPLGSPGTSLYLANGSLTLPNTGGYAPGSEITLDGPGSASAPTAIGLGTVSADGKTITFKQLQSRKLSATAPPDDQPPLIIYLITMANIDGSPSGGILSGSSNPPCDCAVNIPGPVSGSGAAGNTGPTTPLQTGLVTVTPDAPVSSTQPVMIVEPYDSSIPSNTDGSDPSPFSNLIPINKPQDATGAGSLQQQLPVGSYQSQGQSREIVLSYNSLDANPTNAINLTYTLDGSNAGDTSPLLTANMQIQDGNFTYDLPGGSAGNYQAGEGTQFYSLPSGETSEIGINADTSDLPSGEYAYTAQVGTANDANNLVTGTTVSATGTIIVDNSQDSPFGSGWELSGWEEVVPNADGSALLIDGDGSRLLFSAPQTAGGPYGPPPGDYSTLIRLPNGGFERTMTDQTVYVFNPQGQLVTITDPNDNVTTFSYTGNNLTSITDPVGATTTFGYTDGMVSSITTPGGQTTQLSHNAAGNLTEATLPDGTTEQYGYNADHLMTSAIDPEGNTTTDTYDATGLIASMSNGLGNAVQVATPNAQYVMPTSLTYHPATAPTAPVPGPMVDTVTDGNGNVTNITLNNAYELVSAVDQNGPLESIQRSGDLPSEFIDGNGNVQAISYIDGNVSGSQQTGASNDITSGSISAPGNQNVYTFTGTPGESIYYEGISASAGISYALTSPSGVDLDGLGNGPVTLTESGTYSLTFSGSQAGTYSFALVNMSGSTQLALNSTVRASLATSLGDDFYQISASAGEQFEFVALDSADSGTWTVYGPSGELTGSSTSGNLQVTTTAAETLYLVANPDSTGGAFGFEVVEPTTTTTSLTLDTPTTATIAEPGDQLIYTFSGTAGQRIDYNLGNAPLTPQLLAPDGSIAYPNPNIEGGDSSTALLTLTQTGTYTFELTGQTPGTYPFEVSDVASLPAITLGSQISGDLSSSSGLFAIQGQAGQQLEFTIGEDTSITYSIYGVENQLISGNNPNLDQQLDASPNFPATLPEDGTYVVALQQMTTGDPTNYSFEVTDTSQSPVNPSGFDTWHSGSLATGKQTSFTFAGSAGTPIFLEQQGTAATSISYEITDPRSVVQPYYDVILDSYSDVGPIVLPYSGNYTIVLNNSGSNATYDFQLLDLATDAIPLTLGQTVTATLGGNQAAIYSFAGTSGQNLLYEAPNGFETNYNPPFTAGLVSLANPYGSEIGFADGTSDSVFQVSTAGMQYLVLYNLESASTPYTFQLQDFAGAAAIGVNAQVSGTFTAAPQSALYQFTGSAGENIYLNGLNSFAITPTLYTPDGQTLSLSGDVTLPFSGTYYLALAESGSTTTPYSFEILTPATNDFTLTEGAPTSGNLTTPGQLDEYTFTGQAGELIEFTGPTSPSGTVTAQLQGPDGASLDTYGVTALSETGTYTLTVTGYQADSYQFQLVDLSAGPLLTVNTPVSGTLQSDGEGESYEFEGTAGETVDFSTDTVVPYIYEPDGNALNSTFGPIQLPTTGTYTIVLNPNGNALPLNYNLEAYVQSVTAGSLTLGTEYSGSLSTPVAQQLFTFTGTAGQEIYFDDLGTGDLTPNLTSPSGQNVNDFFGVLTESGTYTLSFSSYTGGTYDFRLLDIAAAPSFTLGKPIVGNLNPAAQAALYTFQGSAGQTFAFNDSSDPSITWQLIGPDQQTVAVSGDSSEMLPQNGLYVLSFTSNASTGTPQYDLTISDASESKVATAGFGTVNSGTLAANQQATFTFTASAGLPVYFDNEDDAASPVNFTLNDPTGTTIIYTYNDYPVGPLVLPHSGTYTLLVDNDSNSSAGFSFRMLDLTSVPAIALGTAVTGSIATGWGTNVYSLSGTAGETLVANPALSNLTGVTVGLVQLDGTGYTEGSAFEPVFTLPNTDTSYVIVNAQGSNSAYRFEFDSINSLPVLTSGTTFSNTSQTAYQIAGTAGEEFYFSGAEGYNLNMYDPNHEPLASTEASQNYEDSTVTLSQNGTYLIFPFTPSYYASSTYSIPVNITTTSTSALTLQGGTGGEQVTYDPTFSKPTSITDQQGNQTLYQLDPKTGNVLAVTRVMSAGPNLVTTYTYNSAGQVQTMTDANGSETKYTYDALGRITQITYAVGTPIQAAVEYTYDSAGNVLTYTDENGNVTTYQYDAMNRLIEVTDPLNNITKYAYDTDGNLIETIDPRGEVTTYNYNAADEETSVVAPDGGVTRYEYDGDGNEIATIDPLGHETQYEYDARNRLIATINAAGGVTSQTYDNDNNVLSTTDADGHTTVYTYDSLNRLVSDTDPLGNTTTYQYDLDNDLISTTNANGGVTTYAYDNADRLIKMTDPLGNVTQYAYDGDGNEISTTDALGRTIAMAYDARDRLIGTTDALGHTTTLTYDADGDLLSTTDPLGHTTSYKYDADNRVIMDIDADGQTETMTYDADGNITSTTDQLGRTTSETYDSMNRLKTTTDPLGNVTTDDYDLDGDLVSTTDPLGHTTTYAYDSLLRLVATTNALGQTTTTIYDAAGNVVASIDPRGFVTRFTYDADNRLTNVTDALGDVTHYTYDALGNQASMTDALGHTTTYTYDADNRLIETTDALGGTTTDTYDADGNLNTSTDPLGHTTTYTYDADNRLKATTDAIGGVTTISYDADGNVISLTDPNGNTTTYSYDNLNRLIETTDALGGTTTDTYDAVGNVISMTDPNGNTTTYAYDGDNRLVKTTDALGDVTTETYDADGNVLSTTDARGYTTTYAYDALDRLVKTTDALGDVTTETYDADGNVLSTTDARGFTTTFAYDALNRLVKTTDALGDVSTETYDADGNVLSTTDARGFTTTFAYDALNRLVKTTDALGDVSTETYDADGNVLSTTDARGHTTTYAYDALSRPIKSTDPLGGVTSETYDADGDIVSTTDALGNTTTYTYDAINRLLTTTDPLGNATTNAYDADGDIISTTDPKGNTTSYTFDALDRLVKTTDALGGVATEAYDADGDVISVTDALGHTTTYSYDALDRLIETTDALGGTTTQTYDADGDVASTTDALGHTTTYTYDALDRMLTTTDALGETTSQTYDANGNVISSTDADGNATTYTYDALDRLVKTTDALGGTTTETYDADGNILSQTDPLGRTTTYSYDALDRPVTITDPLGFSTTTAYDADGDVITTTDPLGKKTTYTYDADNRIVSSTDPAGGITTTAYDADGNQTSVTDPNGNTTTYSYDALNRLTAITTSLGNTTTQTYDAVGNLLTSTDPLGDVTKYTYDVLNRELTSTDPDGGVTTYTYDADGDETSITDPDSDTTSYTYDAVNRMVEETTPLGSETYCYDANGNLTSTTDADGRTIDYTYDKLNRETAEIWLNAQNSPIETIAYTYDADSEITSVGDATSAYQFTYDGDGRIASVSNSGTVGVPTVVMTYTYDADGNELSRSDTIDAQAADTITFAYDALNNVTKETQSGPDASDKSVDFSYDADSNLTGVTRYADLTGTQLVAATTIGYDKDNQLTALTNSHDPAPNAVYTYTFDSAGRIVADTTPDGNDTYTYDANGELLATNGTGSQTNLSDTYDANGNRTNTGYQTGPDNEVLSDGTYNYTYDANGNLTSQTDIATGAVTDYTYDFRNRLTEVDFKNSSGTLLKEVTYAYDVLNNRIGETVTDFTTSTPTTTIERFVYDSGQVAFTFDGGGNLTNSYIYAPGQDQILAADNGQGQVLWALSDDQGSVRDVIESNGTVLDHISYDSFGDITAQTNPATGFLFAYAGMQLDGATGLFYDQARFYDAALGRFITQDPTGFSAGDPNLYRYVNNSPLDGVDPSGLCDDPSSGLSSGSFSSSGSSSSSGMSPSGSGAGAHGAGLYGQGSNSDSGTGYNQALLDSYLNSDGNSGQNGDEQPTPPFNQQALDDILNANSDNSQNNGEHPTPPFNQQALDDILNGTGANNQATSEQPTPPFNQQALDDILNGTYNYGNGSSSENGTGTTPGNSEPNGNPTGNSDVGGQPSDQSGQSQNNQLLDPSRINPNSVGLIPAEISGTGGTDDGTPIGQSGQFQSENPILDPSAINSNSQGFIPAEISDTGSADDNTPIGQSGQFQYGQGILDPSAINSNPQGLIPGGISETGGTDDGTPIGQSGQFQYGQGILDPAAGSQMYKGVVSQNAPVNTPQYKPRTAHNVPVPPPTVPPTAVPPTVHTSNLVSTHTASKQSTIQDVFKDVAIEQTNWYRKNGWGHFKGNPIAGLLGNFGSTFAQGSHLLKGITHVVTRTPMTPQETKEYVHEANAIMDRHPGCIPTQQRIYDWLNQSLRARGLAGRYDVQKIMVTSGTLGVWEHHAVAITPKGAPLNQGWVVDPWFHFSTNDMIYKYNDWYSWRQGHLKTE